MNKKQNILNREAVIDILNRSAITGSMSLVPALIMQEVAEELAIICMAYHHADTAEESILTRYAALRPNDDQVHAALISLLKAKKPDGSHYLFSSSRQWLAVFKVLVFLGIMTPEYGCYARMEAYVAHLFATDLPPRLLCSQDALSKKCIGKPFTLPLQKWEPLRMSRELRSYWPVAISFLQFLSKKCGSESGT